MEKKIAAPFAEIEHHILLPWAGEIPEAAAKAHKVLTREVLAEIVGNVPDVWLESIPGGPNSAERREGYLDFFTRRLEASAIFEQEAIVPTPASFDYAILRVVPRVERQEFINAGVVVFCLEKHYLGARIRLDAGRMKALWPDVDVELAKEHLEAVRRICEGDPAAGPIAKLSQRERFHWIISPRSTIIQPSPVHTGVCDETDGLLDRLEKQFLSV